LERDFSDQSQKLALSELDGIKILVVDDEPGAREIIQSYLDAWGMHNSLAANGEEALSLLQNAAKTDEPFDLAIIDLQMPGINGMQLGKSIRADELLKKMKLILLTAFDRPGTGEEAIFYGFDAFLTKPIKQSQLLNAITMLLHKAKSQAEPNGHDSSTPTGNTHRSELILVAEDHPINQQVAILLLQEFGFEAHVASTGTKAMESLKHVPYSLIFMDCQMPEMDGLETTRAIRKAEALTGKHIPIIAMTAHALEGSRAECIAAGMDDYISKPIEQAQLKALLEKWLPGSGSNGEQPAPVDFTALKAKYHDHAGEFMRMFLDDAPRLIDAISECATAVDSKGLLRQAHSLRGICATLYAHPMRTLCSEIENATLNSDMQDLAPLIEKLQAEFERVKDRLSTADI
jgi:CheY-like chemotaxis protein